MNLTDKSKEHLSELLLDRYEGLIPILSLMDHIIRRFYFESKERGHEMIRSAFLSVLTLSDEPKTQFDLSELIFRTPSSISSMSRKLEKEGLIKRQKDPSDRKYQLLTLTEKGRLVSRESDSDTEDILQEIFSPLSEKEIKLLADMLGKIVDDLIEKHGKRAGWYQKIT